jgi:hypothetical protein
MAVASGSSPGKKENEKDRKKGMIGKRNERETGKRRRDEEKSKEIEWT